MKLAIELAKLAEVYHDEHGFHAKRGNYLTTKAIDFVEAPRSMSPPFWDFGGKGLGLVEVTRKRVYAKSAFKRVGYASTLFLVGRNETGTYFAHPVGKGCRSVSEACDWIWSGKNVLVRQGDIALVKGVRSNLCKGMPPGVPKLPVGHRVSGDYIVHNTHPAIPLPQSGQRIIVARRAVVYASQATRD